MTANVKTTHTLQSVPGELTAGDLRAFLQGVPATAEVKVRTDYPDRPGERGTITLTVGGHPVVPATAADDKTLMADPWPRCDDHREHQHRDGKPPWCNRCGWNRGRPAIVAQQYGTPRAEK